MQECLKFPHDGNIVKSIGKKYRKIKEKQIWRLYLHDHILCLWRRKKLAIPTYLKISHLKIKYKYGSFLSFAFSCHWPSRDIVKAATVRSSSLRAGSKSNCFASVLTCYEPKQTEKFPWRKEPLSCKQGIKASADSIYPNPCLLVSLKNLPTRTVWETSQSVTYQSRSPEILAKALTEERRPKP